MCLNRNIHFTERFDDLMSAHRLTDLLLLYLEHVLRGFVFLDWQGISHWRSLLNLSWSLISGRLVFIRMMLGQLRGNFRLVWLVVHVRISLVSHGSMVFISLSLLFKYSWYIDIDILDVILACDVNFSNARRTTFNEYRITCTLHQRGGLFTSIQNLFTFWLKS